jgi:hypothetical protein
MAQAAALDLKINHYPGLRFATYTMGAPRVGDSNWVNLFTAQIDASFREVHQADIVAHLPPMLLNFQHEPMEVFYNGAFNSYKVCNDVFPGESKACSNALPLPTSVKDHTHYRGISIGSWCNAPTLTTGMDGEEREQQNGAEDAEEIDSMIAGLQRAQQVEEREEMAVQGEVALLKEAAHFSEQESLAAEEEQESLPEEEQIRRGEAVQQRLQMQEAEEQEEMDMVLRGLSLQQRLEQQEAEEEEQIRRGLSLQQRVDMQEEMEQILRGMALQQRLEMQEAEEETEQSLPILSKLIGLKHRRISLNIDIDLE